MSDLIQMQILNVSFFICIWQQSSPENHYLENPFVLYPYEITLLSNYLRTFFRCFLVLHPYEITLLSNQKTERHSNIGVLHPYEITLLSNA